MNVSGFGSFSLTERPEGERVGKDGTPRAVKAARYVTLKPSRAAVGKPKRTKAESPQPEASARMENDAVATPSTLILGPAKSGTTALFYAIRAAMVRATGQDIKGLFEPRDMDAFRRYFQSSGDPVFLCKALLGPTMRGMQRAVDRFDRRIVLSRDPCDNIVSRLLFMPPRLLFETDESKCQAYVDLIRRKQADPGSLSILSILHRLESMAGRKGLPKNYRDGATLTAKIMLGHGDRFWMFGYDELVEGRFERLSAFLGVEVTPDFEVDGQHGYVSRSKGSGEWRSWFLAEDIDYFVREVADDYVVMGFDPTETADPNPQINPKTGSNYVQKQVDRLIARRAWAKERNRRELQEVVALVREKTPREKRGKGTAARTVTAVPATPNQKDQEARLARRMKRKAAKG